MQISLRDAIKLQHLYLPFEITPFVIQKSLDAVAVCIFQLNITHTPCGTETGAGSARCLLPDARCLRGLQLNPLKTYLIKLQTGKQQQIDDKLES